MSSLDELVPVLRRLRLSGVLHTLDLRLQQAADDSIGAAEFLLRVLTDEVERRNGKQLQRRLAEAKFEPGKTMKSYDFTFNPGLPKSKLIDLAAGHFMARHENVLLLGPCGVGKSHLAQAIGHRAVLEGKKTLFMPASRLFRHLRAARGTGSHEAKLEALLRVDLLIVDDVGLRPLKPDEAEDLNDIIRGRYERGSLVFTSNRDVSEWPSMFADPLMASATMDRLLHHAHVVVLEGESYRNPNGRKKK